MTDQQPDSTPDPDLAMVLTADAEVIPGTADTEDGKQ